MNDDDRGRRNATRFGERLSATADAVASLRGAAQEVLTLEPSYHDRPEWPGIVDFLDEAHSQLQRAEAYLAAAPPAPPSPAAPGRDDPAAEVWTLSHRGYSGGGRLDVWQYSTERDALIAGAGLAMDCGLDTDRRARELMDAGDYRAVMARYEETSPDSHVLRVQPARQAPVPSTAEAAECLAVELKARGWGVQVRTWDAPPNLIPFCRIENDSGGTEVDLNVYFEPLGYVSWFIPETTHRVPVQTTADRLADQIVSTLEPIRFGLGKT